MSSFRQDINVGLLVFIGVVGALVLLIMVLGVQAWFAYETDVILTQRYAADQNTTLAEHKAEQLENIGDPLGNGIVYGAADGEMVSDGYRYADEEKTVAVIPIHAAMAAIVNQNGGDTTAEAMRAADGAYVHLTNDAFADPQSYVETEAAPATQPAENAGGAE